MEIKKVGVIGCGTMGLGVAQCAAQAGFETVAVKATPGEVGRVQDKLAGSLAKAVERGKMEEATRKGILDCITFSGEESAIKDCDVVIESIIEELETKKDLFKRLEGIVSKNAILASNTSTLSITALMSVCQRRDRVAGMHFFNPVSAMKLVEIVHALETSDETIGALDGFAKKLGKDPVIVQDTTGFIVNRLLTPYLLSAVRLLEQGTGTIADIDKAMKLGAAHPMGPFELADYIGLDVVSAMSNNIYDDGRQQHTSPPHTLIRLVQLGYLGRKSGKGFYDYSQKPAIANPMLNHPVA